MTYTVGFNMPGFLPEVDPVEAETFADAQEMLLAELEEHKSIVTFLREEDMTEEETLILADIENAMEAVRGWDSPNDAHVDKWVYWIQHGEQ